MPECIIHTSLLYCLQIQILTSVPCWFATFLFFGAFERSRGYLPQHDLELLLISTTLQRPMVLPVLIGTWICSLRAIRLHLGLEGSESAVACSFCRPLRSSYQTCRLQPVSGWPQLWGIIKFTDFKGFKMIQIFRGLFCSGINSLGAIQQGEATVERCDSTWTWVTLPTVRIHLG